ncbi:hypothetical protein OL548_17705 [Lysinibacillus sp. MHQ-1]|nr:hypothetical protein OL548_17705 [Lysinibacillus sp. MHQ-1]
MYTNEIHNISNKSRETLFEFVEVDARQAEETGHSNYSYWRSTWQSFLKKSTSCVFY